MGQMGGRRGVCRDSMGVANAVDPVRDAWA